jgi:TolB-like protein/TPR repeat protein
MHPSEELHAILGLFDGDINVYEKETEKGLERYLRIRKMSNHKYLKDEVARAPTTEQAVLDKHRIAVLPFVSMSPDPDDEHFADGMTEEIISTVSGISGLDVISRTSVMRYKKTEKTVKEIGREMEVGSVLEGSFRKAGNRMRVTTQLIDVATEKHLWAQNYDRNLDDIFAVQSDVAKQVADALRVRILSHEIERLERKSTESTTAYTLYLKGRYLWNTRRLEDVRKAAEYFEQAVKEDPGFALGYTGLADCYLILHNRGFDLQENIEKAKTMVAKALELDPGLAEAHATRGLALENEHNLREAEEEYRRAIELKPSYAFAHMWYHGLLLSQLRWDEALQQIEKALELDPLSPVINANHASFYYARKEYGRALELFKRVTTLDPDYTPGRYQLINTYGKMKMFDDMRREGAAFMGLLTRLGFSFVRPLADATFAFYEDDRQTLRRLLPQLEDLVEPAPGSMASLIAAFYFYLGDTDKGFEWLERSLSRGEDISGIKYDPDFDGIRTDPRYFDLLKRLGLG